MGRTAACMSIDALTAIIGVTVTVNTTPIQYTVTINRNGKYQISGTMQALLHSQKAHNNGRIQKLTRAAVIIKAWNVFKAGHKGSLAQLQTSMQTPVEENA